MEEERKALPKQFVQIISGVLTLYRTGTDCTRFQCFPLYQIQLSNVISLPLPFSLSCFIFYDPLSNLLNMWFPLFLAEGFPGFCIKCRPDHQTPFMDTDPVLSDGTASGKMKSVFHHIRFPLLSFSLVRQSSYPTDNRNLLSSPYLLRKPYTCMGQWRDLVNLHNLQTYPPGK